MNEPHGTAETLPVGVRLDFLDALRGLAALYVVIYHMVLIPEPDLNVPRWASLLSHNGGMGVTLFFVVSAFSLFYTMPLRLREPRPWASFFIHRFFRIAPLFYLWIVLSLVRDWVAFEVRHSPMEVLQSVVFVFNLAPQGQQGFVWASWTIGIEMVFYALFPVFFYVARNSCQTVTLTLVLLVLWYSVVALSAYVPAAEATRVMFRQWNFLRHLPVFACGVLAFHLFLPGGKHVLRSRDLGVMLVAAALFVYTALINDWLPSLFGELYYWQGVVFLMLLLGLGWAPLGLLVNKATAYLGRLSYSLYLNHPTIVFVLGLVYASIYGLGYGLTASFLASLGVTLAALIAVSEMTYWLVEVPGIKLGKKVNLLFRNSAQRSTG